MPHRALPLLLCCTALAATAAGCGGDTDSKNDYVRSVELARQGFSTRFGQIQRQFTTTSTAKQDRASLGQFATATKQVIAELNKIKPPSEVSAQHGELVQAYEQYLAAISDARKTAAGNKPADLQQARTDLSSDIEPVQRAVMTAVSDINDQLRN